MMKNGSGTGIITVKTKGKDFQVKKEILIAHSPLLAKMINGKQDTEQLALLNLSQEAFEEILKFMETKNPPDASSNMDEIYAASALLEMFELNNLIADILIEKVNPVNADIIVRLCYKYRMHDKLFNKALEESVRGLRNNR